MLIIVAIMVATIFFSPSFTANTSPERTVKVRPGFSLEN
jgi:hypothetical protein